MGDIPSKQSNDYIDKIPQILKDIENKNILRNSSSEKEENVIQTSKNDNKNNKTKIK